MKVKIGVIVVFGLVTACGQAQQRPSFDGQFFRATVSKNGATKSEFAVSVRGVSASLDGALQAAEYEATRYCVTKFGSSDINWKRGPDQDPETLTIENDSLTFTGTCDE